MKWFSMILKVTRRREMTAQAMTRKGQAGDRNGLA
jgi:hypothetical protein